MPDKKLPRNPTEWRVEEVYTSPQSVLVRLTLTGSYLHGENWPKVGQTLVTLEEEQ